MTIEPFSEATVDELCRRYGWLTRRPEYDFDRRYRTAIVTVLAMAESEPSPS